MKTINDYLPSHLIVCKDNCPYCGKELGEDDGIFLCKECLRKDKEYREQSKIQETNES